MLFFYCKTENQDSFVPIKEPQEQCWIHVEGALKEDLQYICQLTGLHISDLSDTLDYYELPRLEKIHNHILFFTRHPIEQEGHLHTITLTVILATSYFITISPTKSPLIQEILQGKGSASLYKPSEFLVQILLKIAHEFSSQIRKKRHSVMTQGKEMNAVDSEDIFLLTEYEEVLNQYLSSLDPLQMAVEDLGKLEINFLHDKASHEIDDILNSVKQSENLCTSLIKNIRSLRDSYQIIFANKLTRTIKLLTALTIIFSIPNMIASIYGMNVKLPFAEETYSFSLLIIAMFVTSALCGYWFYKKKWM